MVIIRSLSSDFEKINAYHREGIFEAIKKQKIRINLVLVVNSF
jgi:hypothetical protein